MSILESYAVAKLSFDLGIINYLRFETLKFSLSDFSAKWKKFEEYGVIRIFGVILVLVHMRKNGKIPTDNEFLGEI